MAADGFSWTSAAAWAWKNREEAKKALGGLASWFKGKKTPAGESRGILLIGPGGVGKSTLGRLLAGKYDLLFESPGDYNESRGIEHYALKDDSKVEVVVPPGQRHRREDTWTALQADVAAGKYRGIMLVVASGFHSFGEISYKAHPLYRKYPRKPEFLEAFLEEQKADELAILSRLAPHVTACPKKLWFLSLVTKQDLWDKEHAEVEKYYREGPYATKFNDLLGQKDRTAFRHELSFGSLVISNFVTGKGELLKPNAEGYDHKRQVESLRRLLQTVAALKDWEG